MKGYYEIKFHVAETDYFPNFDAFDDDQKKKQLAILAPFKTAEQIDALSSDELNKLFQKTIGHEIADLEMDLMEVFS